MFSKSHIWKEDNIGSNFARGDSCSHYIDGSVGIAAPAPVQTMWLLIVQAIRTCSELEAKPHSYIYYTRSLLLNPSPLVRRLES
jgi:hypothetical protein